MCNLGEGGLGVCCTFMSVCVCVYNLGEGGLGVLLVLFLIS